MFNHANKHQFIDYQDPLAILHDPNAYAIMQQELQAACNYVGENVRVGNITVWGGKSVNCTGLRLGDEVTIYSGCKLVVDFVSSESGIEIKDGGALNFNTYLDGSGGLIIGEKSIIGINAVILSSGHQRVVGKEFDRTKKEYLKTTIGKNTWVGSNVVIMPGINIGDSAVIAAGAVVTHDVPARTTVAGVPAKKI